MKLLKYIYHWLKLGVEYRREMDRIRERYECDDCYSDCGQCGIGTGMMTRPRAEAKRALQVGRAVLFETYWR
jgi:hypothetical protein